MTTATSNPTAPPSRRVLPGPGTTPETATWVAAAREGRFLLPRCQGCGKHHWYPRALCPWCFGTQIDWQAASGRGTVYSFSTMHRVEVPYTLAYITLAEGPTMLSNLVDPPPGGWRIGMGVVSRFEAADDGVPVAVFRPA